MEQNFDLDINNYSTIDLLSFFKLDDSYSLEDLYKRELDIVNELLSNNDLKYSSKYKIDIINFIKSAKEILTSFKNEIKTSNEINKNKEKLINKNTDNNVGRIITPLDTHQVLQTHINPPDDIDGYNYDTNISVYVFNTAARNDFFSTQPSHSTFDLPLDWKNVIQISLASANIPNVMFTFNDESGTNQIYIEEDNTGIFGIVTLPPGNYVPYSLHKLTQVLPTSQASFVDILTDCINNQLNTFNRFQVSFNPSNYTITISNTENNFSMYTIVKDPYNLCSAYSHEYVRQYINGEYIKDKNKISTITYLQTMGYLMGYRDIFYTGSQSYTSESVFDNVYSDYLYFALDDFTGSQTTSNTYGIVGENILAQGILGVIPINSASFAVTFDNNANYIYKKREYFGPVNISRISVKILNQKGNLVNLRETEFSFALQVKTIYNLNKKSKINLRGSSVPF
jgi:hypothetical protein